MYTTTKRRVVEYNNALLLFVEEKISSGSCLSNIIEQYHIVAQDDEALSTLLLNRLRLNLFVFAIKAQRFGDNRKNNLRGAIVSEDLGHKSEDITMGDLCG